MIKRIFENDITNLIKMVEIVEYSLLSMYTSFTCLKLLYCEVDILFLTSIYGFFKYMVLAPSDLMHEIIPLIGIWELRATPSWREPPPKS